MRFITNRSSGKQGHALAEAAARPRGDVALVTTAVAGVAAGVDELVEVETAAEMHAAIERAPKDADVVVMAAAVADFRPLGVGGAKLKKDGHPRRSSSSRPPTSSPARSRLAAAGQVIVGFAAETDDVLERGRRKLERKGCDLLVVNDVRAPGSGFDHDTNEVDHPRRRRRRGDGAAALEAGGGRRRLR